MSKDNGRQPAPEGYGYAVLVPTNMASQAPARQAEVSQPEKDGVVVTHKIEVSEEKANEIAAKAVEKYKRRQKRKKKQKKHEKEVEDLKARAALPADVDAAVSAGQTMEYIPGDVRRTPEPRRRRVQTGPIHRSTRERNYTDGYTSVLDQDAFATAVDALPKTEQPKRPNRFVRALTVIFQGK